MFAPGECSPLVFEGCHRAEGVCFSHPAPGTGSFLSPSLPGIVQCKFLLRQQMGLSCFMENRHLTTRTRHCSWPLGDCAGGDKHRGCEPRCLLMSPSKKTLNAVYCVSGPLVAMSFNEELELLHYPSSGTSPEC